MTRGIEDVLLEYRGLGAKFWVPQAVSDRTIRFRQGIGDGSGPQGRPYLQRFW